MNELEHTFPLPETAAHVLEEVEAELEHEPMCAKLKDRVRENPWQCVGVAFGLGMIVGASLRRLA